MYDLSTLAEGAATLADQRRLRLLLALAETGEAPVAVLVAPAGVSRQACANLLRPLLGAGLVAVRPLKTGRGGAVGHYRLVPERLDDVVEAWRVFARSLRPETGPPLPFNEFAEAG